MRVTDPAVDALWKHVLDNWDSDAAHHAFLDFCQSHEALAEAAVRYRGMKGDRDRGPGAEKRLTAVLVLAMSKLEVSRSEPEGRFERADQTGPDRLPARSLLVLMYLLAPEPSAAAGTEGERGEDAARVASTQIHRQRNS